MDQLLATTQIFEEGSFNDDGHQKPISLKFAFTSADRCRGKNFSEDYFPQYDGFDKKSANVLLVLAGINLFVIAQGIYCFRLLMLQQPKARLAISLFYGAALSCLIVAEFYFLTGYVLINDCSMFFLQTAPSLLYLLTGLIYLSNYSRKIYRVEIQMSESDERKTRMETRQRIWAVILLIIGVSFMCCYTATTTITCRKSGSAGYDSYWMSWTTVGGYMFTFAVLLIQAKHEWTFMNKQFNRNNAPTWRVLIINLTSATSFMVRAVSNFWQIVIPKGNTSIQHVQWRSCQNDTAGFAVFLFFLHFFGEILPLSLIFYMQVYMSVFAKKRKQKAQIKAAMRLQSEKSYVPYNSTMIGTSMVDGTRFTNLLSEYPQRLSTAQYCSQEFGRGQASTLQSLSQLKTNHFQEPHCNYQDLSEIDPGYSRHFGSSGTFATVQTGNRATSQFDVPTEGSRDGNVHQPTGSSHSRDPAHSELTCAIQDYQRVRGNDPQGYIASYHAKPATMSSNQSSLERRMQKSSYKYDHHLYSDNDDTSTGFKYPARDHNTALDASLQEMQGPKGSQLFRSETMQPNLRYQLGHRHSRVTTPDMKHGYGQNYLKLSTEYRNGGLPVMQSVNSGAVLASKLESNTSKVSISTSINKNHEQRSIANPQFDQTLPLLDLAENHDPTPTLDLEMYHGRRTSKSEHRSLPCSSDNTTEQLIDSRETTIVKHASTRAHQDDLSGSRRVISTDPVQSNDS